MKRCDQILISLCLSLSPSPFVNIDSSLALGHRADENTSLLVAIVREKNRMGQLTSRQHLMCTRQVRCRTRLNDFSTYEHMCTESESEGEREKEQSCHLLLVRLRLGESIR